MVVSAVRHRQWHLFWLRYDGLVVGVVGKDAQQVAWWGHRYDIAAIDENIYIYFITKTIVHTPETWFTQAAARRQKYATTRLHLQFK